MNKHDRRIEIAKTVVRKAVAGGWQTQLQEDEWSIHRGGAHDMVLCYPKPSEGSVAHVDMYAIFFDHEFAKALWGDPWAYFTPGQSGDTIGGNFINYLGHLANMAVADDVIDYLEQNGGHLK